MKKLLAMGVAATSLLSATPASAFTCQTNPSAYLGMDGSGWIAVQVDGVGVQKICNMTDAVAGVTAEACQGWYASLLTWRTLGRQGLLYYDPGNPTIGGKTACTQFTQWDARVPYFLEMG